jgi:transcriptional regulator with XRE-family HTH domain
MEMIWKELIAGFPDSQQLGPAVVRMIAAVILGAAIGYEREVLGKSAGLRTHILVTLGTCMFILAASGFGKRLAELRKKRTLTRQQLCDLVGVHVTMLSSYESDRSQPTLEVFDKTERQPQMLDKELLKNWGKIDDLPDDDKLAVKKIVSALLVKHSVELAVR